MAIVLNNDKNKPTKGFLFLKTEECAKLINFTFRLTLERNILTDLEDVFSGYLLHNINFIIQFLKTFFAIALNKKSMKEINSTPLGRWQDFMYTINEEDISLTASLSLLTPRLIFYLATGIKIEHFHQPHYSR